MEYLIHNVDNVALFKEKATRVMEPFHPIIQANSNTADNDQCKGLTLLLP